MILYFLRHASAGEHFANPKKDEKRALDKEGIEQCGYVGRALAALDVQVDVIVSSPLKRATQTASLVGNELGYEGKLQIDAGLRPEAGSRRFPQAAGKIRPPGIDHGGRPQSQSQPVSGSGHQRLGLRSLART